MFFLHTFHLNDLHFDAINYRKSLIIKLKGINKGYSPPELQIETNDEKLSESRCFVATVCYGSEMHKSVLFLQDFRDTRLLTNKIGKEIVCIYYIQFLLIFYLHQVK